MTTDTQTPSTEPAADPTPANVQPVDVELEYKHDHHISGSAEYPVEEALHAKTEENLVPGLWRVYVFRKHPDPITVNCITLKGVNTEHEMPSNLDAEELERAILSVCHRNASERGTRCGFLVRYCHKMPPGQRSKKREVSFELSPSASRPSTERAPSPADSMPAQERWNRQADAWEASATGHGSSGTPFQDTHSPFARHDPPSSWRDNFPPSSGDPARRYDPDDEASRNYQHALANRRRHMFSGDMLPFRPDQMSGDAQKTYMDSILPFQIVNNANNLAYQAFAAAFDMMSSASHETQRLHSIQTAQMLDERKQLMEMLMHQNRVEVENREYRSQQQREGHQAYLEALRLRGDQAQRELAYERTSMHNQFQIGEAQRMLFEQQEKHKNEQTDTFRREIARSLPTAALQGLGLFLDYFGQQKLGAGARAAGTVVGDLLSHATGRGGPQGGQAGPPPGFQAGPPPGFQAGPHAPPRPTPRPTPPPIVDADAPRPSIPRRTIRIRDVATDEEISTSPVRSLCRMVDLAFSQADRERMQSILLPDEWGSLERALRETTDQACVTGLAGVMLSIARDEQRKVAMLSALSPGQRELFEKIGAW
ncbi:MAG: hypothetical protein Q8Q14_02810, partial [Gemmatimonadales bacterium]|nr:hypothetical protein [Gemmatimonadales bacterium]